MALGDVEAYDGPDKDRDPEEWMFPDLNYRDGESDAETDVLSETSDYEHEGSGVPCKHYNHEGCKAGSACTYRHAPDTRSIRDKL